MGKYCKIEGMEKVIQGFHKAEGKYSKTPAVDAVVGFTQSYALYVHEDMEAQHPNGGQAKFLEQPMRQYRSELLDMVAESLKKGITLDLALLKAALRLLREAQKLCPVKTGALRASGFAALEKDLANAITSAQARTAAQNQSYAEDDSGDVSGGGANSLDDGGGDGSPDSGGSDNSDYG